jgi:hypothetical protein
MFQWQLSSASYFVIFHMFIANKVDSVQRGDISSIGHVNLKPFVYEYPANLLVC